MSDFDDIAPIEDPYGQEPGGGAPLEDSPYGEVPHEEPEEAFEPLADDGSPLRRAGPAEVKVGATLTAAFKISRLHTLDNIIVQNALDEFHRYLVLYLAKVSHVTILISNGRLYVNNAAVRAGSGHSWSRDFLDAMERMGVAGLEFKGDWSREATEIMLGCFERPPGLTTPEECFAGVSSAVELIAEPASFAVYDTVSAGSALTGQAEELTISDAARASFYYARLVTLMEECHVAVRVDQNMDQHLRHVRQTVMKIVECLGARFFELRLLGMTATESSAEDPLASHAANVCIISVLMGRLLGLSRGQLAALGFAALYHDLGRSQAGRYPNSPEPSDTDVDHIKDGVRLAMGGKGLTDAGLLRIVVIHEHHMMADRFPEAGELSPHLFSRIVAVADAFDKLQNGTPAERPRNPAMALRAMLGQAKRYDRAIVELLVDVMGKTPRGTLLRLKTGAVHIVIEGGARQGHRPLTRRLFLQGDQPDPERTLIELQSLREVQGEVDPLTLGVDWRREVVG